MFIQKITYIQPNNSKVSFRSNREQEAMLRRLRELDIEKMKQSFAKIQELRKQQKEQNLNNLQTLMDYDIQDRGCSKMAQFLLNFACSIENDSEHSLDEFFKSEIEAARIRKGLSPKCQMNSLEIREEIQSQPVFLDPALTLITAKEMKEYVPQDNQFISSPEYKKTIIAAKKAVVDAVEASDKTFFDSFEIGLIGELTSIIKKSSGLDFGAEYDKILGTLLRSIKTRKAELERLVAKQHLVNPQLKNKLKL